MFWKPCAMMTSHICLALLSSSAPPTPRSTLLLSSPPLLYLPGNVPVVPFSSTAVQSYTCFFARHINLCYIRFPSHDSSCTLFHFTLSAVFAGKSSGQAISHCPSALSHGQIGMPVVMTSRHSLALFGSRESPDTIAAQLAIAADIQTGRVQARCSDIWQWCRGSIQLFRAQHTQSQCFQFSSPRAFLSFLSSPLHSSPLSSPLFCPLLSLSYPPLSHQHVYTNR